MRRVRSTSWHFSEEMKDAGRRIAEAYGIKPLGPGEHRPPGYYFGKWYDVSLKRKKLPPPKDFSGRDDG
jgi:hypothetical protein